ncbi:MAG: hypothetical protein ACRDHL_14890 [Candidatus Promineifilaceae bacterium]
MSDPYLERFDVPAGWTVGDDPGVSGQITGGRYQMTLTASGQAYWATAGRRFGDGVYELEASPLNGVLDNGYGMIFRLDEAGQAFYVFKVSSVGYAYIGRCAQGCAEQAALVGEDWFVAPAVRQAHQVTNVLRVAADGQDMIFYVNDSEVGRASDATLAAGDIGLYAETFAPGGMQVVFDNFAVKPLP